jgi:hypothetical protein
MAANAVALMVTSDSDDIARRTPWAQELTAKLLLPSP